MVETTVRRGLPLIADTICPRDRKADAARRRTRRIRDAAARGRRPGAGGDARLAGAARTTAPLASRGRTVRPRRRAVGRGRPPRRAHRVGSAPGPAGRLQPRRRSAYCRAVGARPALTGQSGPSPAGGAPRLPGGPPRRRRGRPRRRRRLARRPAPPRAPGRDRPARTRPAQPARRAGAPNHGRHGRKRPRAAHRDRRAAVDQRRLHRPDPGDRPRPADGRARPARRHPDRLPGHGRLDRRQENRLCRRCALSPAAPVGHARPDGPPVRNPSAPRRHAHRRAEAGRAARRLQLCQRGDRARPPRRDPAPGRLRGAGVLGGHLAVAARRDQGPQAQRPLPAYPGARDALHEVRRPGGDAGRGDARRDPRARRRPGQGDHRPQRRQRGIPPAAPRRPGKAQGRASASSPASTSSAWSPAWSRTRASARCSRRSRSWATGASAPGR